MRVLWRCPQDFTSKIGALLCLMLRTRIMFWINDNIVEQRGRNYDIQVSAFILGNAFRKTEDATEMMDVMRHVVTHRPFLGQDKQSLLELVSCHITLLRFPTPP